METERIIVRPDLTLRVEGIAPGSRGLGRAEEEHLLGDRLETLVPAALAATARVVVREDGGRPVAVAVYHCAGDELRVIAAGIDPAMDAYRSEIVQRLMEAIELAAMAGGCSRILVEPPAVAVTRSLEAAGYRMAGRCGEKAGAEKRLG